MTSYKYKSRRSRMAEIEAAQPNDDHPKKSYKAALIQEEEVPKQEASSAKQDADRELLSPSSVKANTKQPPLTPGKARIPRIPSPTTTERKQVEKMALQRENTRLKNPPNAVRMTTVAMTARSKESSDIRRTFQDSLRRPRKIVGWDEATNARPPLQIDMDGPSPWSYSPHLRKPLKETNAPAFTFGKRSFVEKAHEGTRTSWDKTWFQNSEVWSQKVDFHSDRTWPAPNTYRNRPLLGPRQSTLMGYPSYSFGIRRGTTFSKKGSEKEPAPNEYNIDKADIIILKKGPAFTHQLRRHGTILWGGGEKKTPGPGMYDPQDDRVFVHRPAFTIQGIRREKTHELGPYAST